MIEIISVPIIVTAVYWIMNLYKYITKSKEKYIRLIPVISAILGATLGLISFFAATGTNQIFKQIKKDKEGK